MLWWKEVMSSRFPKITDSWDRMLKQRNNKSLKSNRRKNTKKKRLSKIYNWSRQLVSFYSIFRESFFFRKVFKFFNSFNNFLVCFICLKFPVRAVPGAPRPPLPSASAPRRRRSPSPCPEKKFNMWASFLLFSARFREHVKKLKFLPPLREEGWGRSTSPPPHAAKNASFFSQNIKKNCLECSETKEYAKIFCEIFARESV